MKGTFKCNDFQKLFPNPYDLGVLTNFATVFEGHLWDFWWPTAIVPKADGTQFPMVSPVDA